MINLILLILRWVTDFNPEDPIRSVDPIVFNRIRVGFHRKSTSFIKNRSDPTWFLSDSYRSESGPDFIGIWRNPMRSGPDSDRQESDTDYSNPIASDPPWISWEVFLFYMNCLKRLCIYSAVNAIKLIHTMKFSDSKNE
jgi:hypothetical protein